MHDLLTADNLSTGISAIINCLNDGRRKHKTTNDLHHVNLGIWSNPNNTKAVISGSDNASHMRPCLETDLMPLISGSLWVKVMRQTQKSVRTHHGLPSRSSNPINRMNDQRSCEVRSPRALCQSQNRVRKL